jgi:UDP-N-acetylmuramoyl-tripeptide--D-alanyl-D-alanine ligase
MGWRYSLEVLAGMLALPVPEATAMFTGVSTDSRSIKEGEIFFALSGPNYDGDTFVDQAFASGAAAAVTTGAHDSGPCLMVDDPLLALQRFAAAHRDRYDVPIFAVTGSVGKTSTKDFTAAILGTRYKVLKTKGNLNNEIGCPRTLLELDDTTDFAVIEMGANHVGEIASLCALARPTESTITTIAPAHLEGFGSLDNVAAAKGEIMEGLSGDGTFYINVDDLRCVAIGAAFTGRKVRFGSAGDVVLETCFLEPDGELSMQIAPVGRMRLPLYSRAHATNVLLAIAVGLEHGVTEFEEPLREAAKGAARFKALQVGPLLVFDDTYNANPASVHAALDTLGERATDGARIAALGEMLELGDAAADLHREAGEWAGRCGVTHLFALGEHACDTIAGARSADVAHAEALPDHQSIAEAIYRVAQPGDTLLVKGSRGLTMERVIDALAKRYEHADSSVEET